MKNGLEDYYVIKNNKKLRYGYTTGSCAAAAAKAAARMLLTGETVENVDLMTPKGILLHLEILDIHKGEEEVSCAVRKDGGDDPDATHGLLVYAAVRKKKESGVTIDGGRGVGRVTKRGLEQPVGAAAINRTPRAMITEAVEDIADAFGYTEGFTVVISIPGGEEVAKKTFNPRLGILGGISVLGTSGIVVPMSEDALIASIHAEMRLRKENGGDYLLITPGNYGAAFVSSYPDVDVENSVKCSNYVGETLDYAVNLGIRGILFVADIGKFIKVSGGIMNTHSRCADSRAELMTAAAIRAGADLETAKQLLETITTVEAIGILKEKGLLEKTMAEILPKIHYYLQHRIGEAFPTEAILFSNEYGFLGETAGAQEMLKHFRKDKEKQ
ncbi:cobalt-precorrin-5B (C(1))-methyltransferase CbiD [Clostridium fessum]|uniref:cobalt-precorrin-5B (C(1))-methyltransferase CbiD n=1 Tax=Clostridium fessum TaxID=2126740 RepID=UPI002A800B5C|nr:cobalt-precorrin-5B (C(1))-methyltransferase CbiD [Clostridium fessum]MDY4927581.1 cobalt-precorrin-5B (C(1))-methyltransferase CbiD [Clostridium fessum]